MLALWVRCMAGGPGPAMPPTLAQIGPRLREAVIHFPFPAANQYTPVASGGAAFSSSPSERLGPRCRADNGAR
jgi:hypothetical protein